MMLPIRFDIARFLTLHDFWAAVDFRGVPERYRDAMRGYLERGDLPVGPLRLLLEGNVDCVRLFRDDAPGLIELADWLHALPAACWGSTDQVRRWIEWTRERLADVARDTDAQPGAR